MPKTVRRVIEEFYLYIGKPVNEFNQAERIFGRKLFDLGRQLKTQPVAECDDVNAIAFLTDEEYIKLTQEYKALS